MSAGRKHQSSRLLALVGGLCVPLAALAWSSPASAATLPVSISVDSSVNPSLFGQDVTFTATLTTSDSGSLDPGDGMQFQDNGNDIVNCNSQLLVALAPGIYTATCDEPTNSLSIGDHAITAIFNGDSTYFPNTGLLPTQTVDQADTTTTITSPSPGTSTTYGNESQLAFNVTVAGMPGGANLSPSGQVNLYDGTPGPDTYLCTAFVNGGGGNPSNGNCFINDTTLNAGPYVITAVYGGDSNYIGSSSAPQDLTVDQVISQMQVFPVPGYALYGAESGNFFIVGVGGNSNNGRASGSVSITADGVNLVAPGTCSASNGGANPCFIHSATALPASTTPYTVTASYPGDANFLPASTTVPLSIFPATSSVVLAVSPASTSYGDEGSVTISVTVTSGTTGSPAGSVAVQNGGDTVCTIALEPASLNTSSGSCLPLSGTQLPPGKYALTANYPGDGNFESSVSSARSLTIANGATQGYWEVGSDGGIFSFGTAHFYGSMGGKALNAPIVGIASTQGGGGYWLVANDGGVFAFGDAHFYGSMGGMALNAPIVGITSTPDGRGYWLVAKDGGVFAFGDAHFYGSMGGARLNKPIVSIASSPSSGGYWEVASDGGIFAFDAPFLGSAGAVQLAAPIVGMASLSSGGGYWEVASDGGVFAGGAAPLLGSMGGQVLNRPIEGMAATPSSAGYRLVASDGGIFAFGDAEFDGSMGGVPLNSPIVGIASSQ
jgi:Bacterial Ig-like domain (group 3)